MSLNGKYEIYIDGSLRDSGSDLSANMMVEANGTVVVGQEQVNIFFLNLSISLRFIWLKYQLIIFIFL